MAAIDSLSKRSDLIMPVMIALFVVVWASAFAAAKIALVDCPPLLLLGTRFLTAGSLILLILALSSGVGEMAKLRPRDVGALALIGIFNNACYLGLSYVGLTTVSSGFTAVIVSANPLLTTLAAAPLLGERLTGQKLLGLVLGMLGVAIVMRSRLANGHEDMTGTLFVVGALITLSAATLLFKMVKTPVPLFLGSGIQSMAGGLALLPVAFMLEDPSSVRITAPLAGSFLYLTLAASIGAFSLWLLIVSRTSATKASALHFLIPPLGLLFGWAILHEPVPPMDLLGIVPIAVGIRLVTR